MYNEFFSLLKYQFGMLTKPGKLKEGGCFGKQYLPAMEMHNKEGRYMYRNIISVKMEAISPNRSTCFYLCCLGHNLNIYIFENHILIQSV